MTFDTLEDYIRAFSKNRELAIMPVPLVAEHLDKSAPAVTAMLSSGRLEEIKIGKNRFVGLKSLVDMQEDAEKQVEIVERYLIKQAKKGVEVLFYEPVMAQVGMKTTIPADRDKIGKILGTISHRSFEEKGVLLSVLVHRKTAGLTCPSSAFFDLARNVGLAPKGDRDHDFVKKQTAKVLKAYAA